MPEVEYVTTVNLPPETIWEFVKDMNNWAPMLTGYQKHEIIDDTDSIWTLKGDVGVLARRVELRAHVTEWNGPERVSFTLTGINEEVDGGGTLSIGTSDPSSTAPKSTALAKPEGLFRKMLNGIFRFFFRLMHGKGPERAKTTAPADNASELRFVLRMDAGGPTGPLVNAMLAPALLPAAEDLANKIAAHLEKQHAA
jgi:carbon monoxide dehydrogenase subunit G